MKSSLLFLAIFFGVVLTVHLAMNGKVGVAIGNPRIGNMVFWCIGAVGAIVIGLTGWSERGVERSPTRQSHPSDGRIDGRVPRVRHRLAVSQSRRRRRDDRAARRADPQQHGLVPLWVAGIAGSAGHDAERAGRDRDAGRHRAGDAAVGPPRESSVDVRMGGTRLVVRRWGRFLLIDDGGQRLVGGR